METLKIYGDIELLKVEDIAKALGTHVITIRRYIRSGKLKAQKVGKSYYVTKENFKNFINGGGGYVNQINKTKRRHS